MFAVTVKNLSSMTHGYAPLIICFWHHVHNQMVGRSGDMILAVAEALKDESGKNTINLTELEQSFSCL